MSANSRRPWIKRWVDVLNRPWVELPRKQCRLTQRLMVEQLETRLVPAPVTLAPGKYHQAFTSDSEFLSTSGTYEFDGNSTINPGVTLTVGAGVNVQIDAGVTLTANGTLNFGSGSTVALKYSYGATTQIVVGNGGLLTATGTAFRADTTSNDFTQIDVTAGGHLKATNSTFFLNQLYLDNGSILSAGDLVGNGFDLPLWVPAADVQYLAGSGNDNLRFQDINILNNGSLASGQTLALNVIGTATTANLRYVIRNFTIGSGATMTVAPNVSIALAPGYTLADNGVLTFAAGPAIDFVYSYGATTQIVVGNGGLLTATGTAFRADTTSNDFTQIDVTAGGHLKATNSTFFLNQLYLDNGSILSAGDLVGNGFDLPLWVPAADVQYLAGSGNDNLRFQDINILNNGSLASGQTLALNVIGTATTANLRYVIRNFTIGSGATMTVAPNVSIALAPGYTLADNGVLTFAAGPAIDFVYSYGATTQIVVGNGGLLTATGTAFRADTTSNDFTQIDVTAGGHLKATNSTFFLNQLYLDNGSILSAGDLVGNGFDLPLWVPAADVQYLAGSGNDNLRFQDINILNNGSLASGQTLALNVIGTATTANLRYVIRNFTIGSGATMTVAPNVSIALAPGYTLADNGVLTFAAGPAIDFVYSYGATTQIVVGNGGLLTATGTAFRADTTSNDFTQIDVTAGGHLKATNSTFFLNQLYLDNGSILSAGDLVGNGFDLPLWVPAADVQYLAGSGNDNLRFQDINILNNGSLASGQTLALNVIGTATTANLRYVIRNFTIGSGATMTVAPNVSIALAPGYTLADNGVLTFAAGPAIDFVYSYGATTQIVVGNGGLLTATGTAFRADTTSNDFTQIDVTAGGHLKATNSTFFLNQLYLDNGSILSAGDLVGNGFDLPLWVPAADVQYLAGSGNDNLRFQDINILNNGSLASGQTLALNVIGTATTANLRYVIRNFTIGSGATMTVAPNVSIALAPGYTLADNGVLTFAAGPAIDFVYSYGATTQIVVGNGGLLTATGTAFRADTTSNDFTQIDVTAGGHLKATNSTFFLNQLYLDNGSILSAGDLVGNGFDLPLWVPAADVQYLAGSGNDNLRFQDINILNNGSLASGQTLALNVIGTATTANLRYVIRNFTIGSGATMTVAPNVSIALAPGYTLADNGVLTFAAGPAIDFVYSYGATTQIVVGNGGLLTATGTAFRADTTSNDFTQIDVTAGGHLKATNSTFFLNQLYLDNGSILSAGDLVGNGFDLPLWVPAADVQYLAGSGNDNLRFQDINILNNGSLASGQTLALNVIGTATTANLRYVIRNFTIGSGATMTVAPNVSIALAPGYTLADNGVLTFAAGPAIDFVYSYGATTQIVVGNGGLLTATGTAFRADTTSNDFTQIDVTAGGHLKATNSTFAMNQLTLAAGSGDNLQFVSFVNQLAIDSGALINISYNDLQGVSANGVIPSGAAGTTIDLSNNYWGTTDGTQIQSKIKKGSTLPLVQYSPPLSARPVHTVALPASATFSTAAQSVALTANLTSPSGLVTEGTVTFTLLNGDSPVGNSVTANVTIGKASASYALPAGLSGDTYAIQAVYNGTANFAGPSDSK